ncbi:uncharacterized protein TM35_000092730 [Trypanosoma theileri]|uniref:Uncharacterized protein n=1 Tax=Trypanosoma theileri TaxID=67003 RepID=A0A1X0P0H5_9TRYP|nr:uncharacterized protein TM35_000092730 [Trypanosoma theileri]ORC90223.1 hypothetical protein TM35_000092730 [Trypanosoma theileri]
MSAMDAPPLRARTALLEELRDMQKQQQQQQRKTEITHTRKSDDSVNDRDNNDNDGELGSSVPMAVRFVRGCPPLGDPSWAMEELLRINQNVAVWTGTKLSSSVWAFPGSGQCPFETTEADFLRHH